MFRLCGHGAQRCCDSKNCRLGKVKTLAETNAIFIVEIVRT